VRVPGVLERAETAAFRDLFDAVPPELAERHGFAVTEIGGATCGALRAVPGLRELNRVMGCGLHAHAGDDELDAIERWYGGSPFVVALSPEAGPPDLAARLAARGFTADYAWMKFARTPDGEATAPTDLRVEGIGTERARDFASVVIEGFGMPSFMHAVIAALPGRPGWTCFVAYAGDAPGGAGALFVDGDSAWTGFGATLPALRGRGAQSALLAARIRAAAEAGCSTVTTETGVREEGRPARSYRNLLRAGFEEVYERPNWRSPEPLAAA
jgi:GNAT superfamily N-acetyltransferase